MSSKVRRMRQRLGLTQREAARRLGISESYLCNIEAGRRRTKKILLLALQHLACQQTRRVLYAAPCIVRGPSDFWREWWGVANMAELYHACYPDGPMSLPKRMRQNWTGGGWPGAPISPHKGDVERWCEECRDSEGRCPFGLKRRKPVVLFIREGT